MNLGQLAIRGKTIVLVFAVLLLVGGLLSYHRLGRLEDPEFTLKAAVIVTPYPGATAQEVEAEVSDEIERAVQALKQIDYVRSSSEPGLSVVRVTIKNNYDKATLPQVWDELRRKVTDAQRRLPPGAGPSVVNDDFGDVYGVFIGISGPEYSLAELRAFAQALQRELLLVEDVAKVELFAERTEAVYVEIPREKMAQFGVSPQTIAGIVRQRNLVADAGSVDVGPESVRFSPVGGVSGVRAFEDILLAGNGGALVRLGDIARVRREYLDPAQVHLRVDGEPAVGLAISTVPGGNVVDMGAALQKRVAELTYLRPVGVDFHLIAVQSEAVTAAIEAFIVNLVEAVAIVIVVLLVFMGLRSGLLIGAVLVLTICGTFILMDMAGIMLERISLGALVIALGMLVDNAIVVVDGTLAGLARGEKVEDATSGVVQQTAIPLLMATIIAILSFAAIGTSDDSTGEYTRSLYYVLLYSLGLSWVTAMTVTPVLCVLFLKPPKAGGKDAGPGMAQRGFRRLLGVILRHRRLALLAVLSVFAAGVVGFGGVKQSFFPASTRPQFMIDLWLPRGTEIDETARQAEPIEAWLQEQDGVTQVTTVVGQGAPRFLLTYAPENSDSGYAQMLVTVDDYRTIDTLEPLVQAYLSEHVLSGTASTKRFQLGPGEGGKIQARLSGPDANVLRDLEQQAKEILLAEGAVGVRGDWRERVKVLRPELAEQQARQNGLDLSDVAAALLSGFKGEQIGVYREGDDLLPVLLRAPRAEREDAGDALNKLVWSPVASRWIPLRQVVRDVKVEFVDDLVQRRDRMPTITVHADPKGELASALLARARPKIEALDFPVGYKVEWGGEYEGSRDAQAALVFSVALFGLLMVLTTIVLFNALRQPLVIWMSVPLVLVGVTVGLRLTDKAFDFMSMLGFLSLVGMAIKNAIVLIDEADTQIAAGKPRFTALIQATTSRVRPVTMAALTTMLGMLPLFTDAFFVSMAVTIVFGLGFATLFTLLVVPLLYAAVFRVRTDET